MRDFHCWRAFKGLMDVTQYWRALNRECATLLGIMRDTFKINARHFWTCCATFIVGALSEIREFNIRDQRRARRRAFKGARLALAEDGTGTPTVNRANRITGQLDGKNAELHA